MAEHSSEKKPRIVREPLNWPKWAIYLFAFVMAVVYNVLFKRIVPDLNWPLNLDRIVLFLAIYFVTLVVTDSFKWFVLAGAIGICGWLSYGSIAEDYGWRDAALDYKGSLHACLVSTPVSHWVEVWDSNESEVEYRDNITMASDYDDPSVRNFALHCLDGEPVFEDCAAKYPELNVEIRAFAVCKKINSQWRLTNDSTCANCFKMASESVVRMAGNCGDHAVFMASCIRAVGGTSRIVVADGVAHPQMLIDWDKWADVEYLVGHVLFKEEMKELSHQERELHYYREDGDVWLSMDFTQVHPGGSSLGRHEHGAVVNI